MQEAMHSKEDVALLADSSKTRSKNVPGKVESDAMPQQLRGYWIENCVKPYVGFVSSNVDSIGDDGVPADEQEENYDDEEISQDAADIVQYVSHDADLLMKDRKMSLD
jgi:hypothetical protein